MSRPSLRLTRPWCLVGVAWISFLVSGCDAPGARRVDQPDPGASSAEAIGRTVAEGVHVEERDEDAHVDPHDAGILELSAEAVRRSGIRSAVVELRRLEGEMTTTGQVDYDQNRLAHVSPRIRGRVHAVRGQLGQEVARGEILAEVDSIELGHAKAEFLQARARRELAQTSYAREQALFAEHISSERAALVAEAELREAAAAFETAKQTLLLYGLSQADLERLEREEISADASAALYALRAPFAGTLVERHATLGELVGPERNLFTLADLSRVWIWVDIAQRDLGRVHLGDEARARVDTYPGVFFTGVLSYLSAEVDPDTRTVSALLDVPNHGRRLRPGMFVDVELFDPHRESGEGSAVAVPAVPEDGLQRDGSESVVFVVLENGGADAPWHFERREVRAVRRSGGWVEIAAGLAVGEDVVTQGAFVLKSAISKDALGGGHSH